MGAHASVGFSASVGEHTIIPEPKYKVFGYDFANTAKGVHVDRWVNTGVTAAILPTDIFTGDLNQDSGLPEHHELPAHYSIDTGRNGYSTNIDPLGPNSRNELRMITWIYVEEDNVELDLVAAMFAGGQQRNNMYLGYQDEPMKLIGFHNTNIGGGARYQKKIPLYKGFNRLVVHISDTNGGSVVNPRWVRNGVAEFIPLEYLYAVRPSLTCREELESYVLQFGEFNCPPDLSRQTDDTRLDLNDITVTGATAIYTGTPAAGEVLLSDFTQVRDGHVDRYSLAVNIDYDGRTRLEFTDIIGDIKNASYTLLGLVPNTAPGQIILSVNDRRITIDRNNVLNNVTSFVIQFEVWG